VSVLGIGLVVVGVAFLVGSSTMQWLGIDTGRAVAPKYVWREFRRFGRGTIELGFIALCLAVVLH
jgi:hypothetical protein